MKKIFCIAMAIVINCNFLNAQQKTTVNVQSEVQYDKIIPKEMVYEYENFKKGKLYYNSGIVADNEFNYNLVTGKLLFKDKSGRELEFAFPDKINMVLIDSTYWMSVTDGLGKVVYNEDNLVLIKYRATVCTDIRKEGAFGAASSTSAITNITSIQGSGGRRLGLLVKGEYDFEVKVIYYLIYGDKIETADAKGFRKIFPQNKKEINSVLKSKKLDLTKETDIIGLIKVLTFK